MKTRHLVLSIAAAGLLAACSQSGFRNVDYTLDSAVGDWPVVRVSTLEKKAASGDPEAQRMLGSMYYWGEHVDQNEKKAIAWWNRAAAKGDEEAAQNVALVTAGMPIEGEMHSGVGKKYWASIEEGYFAATDEFDRTVLPFQDSELGEDPMAEEEPSVLEKILSPLGEIVTNAIKSATQ
jgi:TPR repeat protein